VAWQDGDSSIFIINFKLDNALELQKIISQASGGNSKRDIWVLANFDNDGFAAQGFTRSLRKELFSLNLRLVLLDKRWTPTCYGDIVRKLCNIADLEHEVFIDQHGFIQVPRIVEIKTPSLGTGHHSLPRLWALDKQRVVNFCSPKLSSTSVLVQITCSSPSAGGLRGFSGIVLNPGYSKWARHSPVFGVYDGDLSNCISIHEGQIAPLETIAQARLYADAALPMIVLSFCLGIGIFNDPTRLVGRHICLTERNFVSLYLQQLLSKLGAHATIVSGDASVETLTVISESDVVLCGLSIPKDIQFIKSNVRPEGGIVFWNDPTRGIQSNVTINPWLVGDTLRAAIGLISLIDPAALAYSRRPEDYLDMSQIAVKNVLFDSNKTYFLVGGIGSIGLHIALWMYEVSDSCPL